MPKRLHAHSQSCPCRSNTRLGGRKPAPGDGRGGRRRRRGDRRLGRCGRAPLSALGRQAAAGHPLRRVGRGGRLQPRQRGNRHVGGLPHGRPAACGPGPGLAFAARPLGGRSGLRRHRARRQGGSRRPDQSGRETHPRLQQLFGQACGLSRHLPACGSAHFGLRGCQGRRAADDPETLVGFIGLRPRRRRAGGRRLRHSDAPHAHRGPGPRLRQDGQPGRPDARSRRGGETDHRRHGRRARTGSRPGRVRYGRHHRRQRRLRHQGGRRRGFGGHRSRQGHRHRRQDRRRRTARGGHGDGQYPGCGRRARPRRPQRPRAVARGARLEYARQPGR